VSWSLPSHLIECHSHHPVTWQSVVVAIQSPDRVSWSPPRHLTECQAEHRAVVMMDSVEHKQVAVHKGNSLLAKMAYTINDQCRKSTYQILITLSHMATTQESRGFHPESHGYHPRITWHSPLGSQHLSKTRLSCRLHDDGFAPPTYVQEIIVVSSCLNALVWGLLTVTPIRFPKLRGRVG